MFSLNIDWEDVRCINKQGPFWNMQYCNWMDNNPFVLGFHRPWLTHWGRVMHIWVRKVTIIGSDNGLSPGQHQAIIVTNAGILLIELSGTNFSEIVIKIYIFSFKKMYLKMLSGKWQPFCLSLSVVMSIEGTKSFSGQGDLIKYWLFYRSQFQMHFPGKI